MLAPFRRPRHQSQHAARPRRVSLTLEALEDRYCPATPAAPQITLTAQPLNSGRLVELAGTVTDSDPATVTITFSGVVSASTTANASGSFDCAAQASGLGTVSAVGADTLGLTSNTAQATITSAAPTLTLAIAYGAQRTITLSGQVTDAQAGACTVQFTGVATGSTTTNADGTYRLTVSASQLGTVQAVAQDPWGQKSAAAQLSVTSAAPSITNFQAIRGTLNVWTFQGQVTDESAQGLVVRFGGLPSLAGYTATVRSDGWFYLTVELPDGEQGTASAQTTDWWGLDSNESLTDVSPSS
jgi:hypothetical protein